MPILRLSRLVLRTAISILLLIAILWAAAALWIDGPESRALAGALAGGFLLTAALAAALVRPWWRAAVAVFVPFAFVLAWWLTLVPGNDRDWQADVAKLPTATIEGSLLTVCSACLGVSWRSMRTPGKMMISPTAPSFGVPFRAPPCSVTRNSNMVAISGLHGLPHAMRKRNSAQHAFRELGLG